MDHALRVLREGPQQGSGAPLITMNDNLDIVGGTELFHHALTELSSAIFHQRAQATRLLIITTLRPPLDIYTACCSSMTLGTHINILDAFTDKHGWIAKYTSRTSSFSSPTPLTKGITSFPFHHYHHHRKQQQQQLLDKLQSHLLSYQDLKHTALVIDSLLPLLDTLGIGLTCQLLHTMTSHVSCIFASFHTDIPPYLHKEQQQAIHALEAISYGCIELMNVRELEKDAVMATKQQQQQQQQASNSNSNSNSSQLPPSGKLRVKLRRRLGRYKTESQLYSVDKDGKVELYGVPEGLPSVQTLIALNQSKKKKKEEQQQEGSLDGGEQKNSNKGSNDNTTISSTRPSLPSPMASSIDAATDQLAGGMKLSLTTEEEEARRRVQLPYEHHGEGGKWQTGDWKDYLPVIAGGRGGEVHSNDHSGLGRILYVRDSDSSDPDSDEDPDDDLDI